MADDQFQNTLFAFILMGLFGMLILTVVVQVGGNYGKDTSEVVGGSLALSKFNESISSIESNAQTLKARFDQKSIWSQVAGIVLIGIFPIASDMMTMIFTPFSLITDVAENMLGIPVFVTSVILGLLILSMIFALWRLLKIGT